MNLDESNYYFLTASGTLSKAISRVFYLSKLFTFKGEQTRKTKQSDERLFRHPVHVKSVQSALSDLLTTSATHGTFSRPSTRHGLILIGLELNTNARESFEHC